MAKPFELPWTLNDENEFGIPMLPWYVTNQEMGLAVLGTIFTYIICSPVLGTGLINFAAMAVSGVVIMHSMMRYKNGKPASWLWDLRLALGMFPLQRGLLKVTRHVRWLSQHHLARPSPFLTGVGKVGEDLTISAPWMVVLPPVTNWAPCFPPRRRRVFSAKAAPAPIWFQVANGFANVVNPRIPVTVTWELKPERTLPPPTGGNPP